MKPPAPLQPRGPGGAAPSPPDWLGGSVLPLDIIPANVVLHRIHRISHGPIFFGPGIGNPPASRFDSASGRFGVIYVALSLPGALAETILRNPQRRMVSLADITERAASELICERPLRVVKLYGEGLQAVGTDNSVSTGPYGPCGLWTDALFDHANKPDGIAYQSRHDSSQLCFALFEREDFTLEILATKALGAMLNEVSSLLDLYGKSVAPDPR